MLLATSNQFKPGLKIAGNHEESKWSLGTRATAFFFDLVEQFPP